MKATPGLDIGVADIVAALRYLAAVFAFFGHGPSSMIPE
jgi:hypothetical protein